MREFYVVVIWSDGKELYEKKCAARAVILFCLLNLYIAFLTSSLLSPSSLLELSVDYVDGSTGRIHVFLFGRFQLVHPSYVNIT